MAVGAREVLVAYNLWLAVPDLALARHIAAQLRGPGLRTLGLAVGDRVQVSCNLIDPERVGPDRVFDAVASQATVERAELVGLMPDSVLRSIDPQRWVQLGISEHRTIESRLARRALEP
jgi:glutamate formiminotransferase